MENSNLYEKQISREKEDQDNEILVVEEVDKRIQEQGREEDLAYLRGLLEDFNANDSEMQGNRNLDEIRDKLSVLLLKYPDPADTEMKELYSKVREGVDKRIQEQGREQQLQQELQQQFSQITSMFLEYNKGFDGDINTDKDYYFRYITSRINEDIKELKGSAFGGIFNRKKIKELENLYNTLWDSQNGYIRKYYQLQQQIKN